MKRRRITKIWSVGLTLALLVAMLAFAAPQPAEAAPGAMTFTGQTLPTAAGDVIQNGSDVTDIAVASDGSTIYAIDGTVSCNTTNFIRKSTNGGQSFANVAGSPSSAGDNPPRAVAVAPDDPNVIAVVEAAAGANLVHISTNGGTTWSTLPAFVAPSAAAEAMDVAIGPARAGTLLGREYAVALSDNTTSVTAAGDLQIVGSTTAWRSAGRNENSEAGIDGEADFLAVAFDPNFVGTRVLIAVAAVPTAGNMEQGVSLYLVNDSTGLEVMAETVVDTTSQDYRGVGADAGDIVKADIALPSDFDPTTGSGRRAYLVTAHTTATNDDVFRVDNTTFRALGAAKRAYHSVSFSGTIDEGTLFTGDRIASTVRFTTNPQVSLPTWTSTKKAPSGSNGVTVVRAATDFATTSRVFAGTSGGTSDQSAFSVSNNAGISFNQESIIDLGAANVTAIDDLAVTSDGAYVFMGTNAASTLSLWKSATPVSATSWSRIDTIDSGTTAMVRTNPDWADSPVVYFANVASGGRIRRSGDGGDIFATRASPSGVTPVDIAVQDANVVYLARSASTNVYKSTTGAWTWGLPKHSGTGNIISLAVAKEDHVLVGKADCVSWSTDGGSTFTRVSTGLTAANYIAMPDDDYENNNVIFAGGDNAAAGNIWRYVIGESTTWESINNAPTTDAAIIGLEMQNGTIYGQTATYTNRNMYPTLATGTVTILWNYLDDGAPTGISIFTSATGSNVLYAASPTVLYGFEDAFATEAVVLTSPGDGATVGIDPVTGRADTVTLVWNPIGTGIGAGDRVDIQLKKKGESWSAAYSINDEVMLSPTSPMYILTPGTGTYPGLANTEYEWRVRYDRAVSGQIARTARSSPFTIKIQAGTMVQQPHAGPIILGPQGGATTGLTPGVSWAPYAGATKYQVILATDPGLKNRVAGTPVFVEAPAWQATAPLEYSTTYFFSITAVEPTVSPQSVGTFVTMGKAAAPPPPPPPPVTVKEVPAPIINIPPAPAAAAPITPAFIWAIVIIGAILIIAVLVLIVRTRRPM